jgi:tetratricopeptide (TPR) repeat protein
MRSAWVCSACAADVPPPPALILPFANYRTLDQLAETVQKACESASADHDPCPKCQGASKLAHSDYYFYNSELASDLVVRLTPGAAPALSKWSLAGGSVPEAWSPAHDKGIARDALIRTLAAQREEEDADGSMATLREAVRLIPGDDELLKFMPWTCKVGALDLCAEVAAAHVKAKPDAAEGHYWLAQATIEAISRGQRPQSAIDGVVPELERAIQLNTDYPDAQIALANVSRIRRRDDEAEKALRALIQNHPDHPEGNYTLGLVLLEKNPAEALGCFERGEKAAPEDADYPRSRARALIALNRPEEARAAISRAKTLAPNDGRIDQVAAQIQTGTQKSMTLVIRLVVGLILLGVLGAVAWMVISNMKSTTTTTAPPPHGAPPAAKHPAGKKK